jgi:hypothetical protein
MDWLSRLFEMMPVRGRVDLRCSYGAPWRIEQGPGATNEIPYHAVLSGSATLEGPAGDRLLQLKAGDILLLPGNPRHVMHDGSGAAPLPARNRASLNFTISENLGSDDRPIYCADTSPSRRRTIAWCAAICRRALSCMPALTLDGRKRPRSSLASSPSCALSPQTIISAAAPC